MAAPAIKGRRSQRDASSNFGVFSALVLLVWHKSIMNQRKEGCDLVSSHACHVQMLNAASTIEKPIPQITTVLHLDAILLREEKRNRMYVLEGSVTSQR